MLNKILKLLSRSFPFELRGWDRKTLKSLYPTDGFKFSTINFEYFRTLLPTTIVIFIVFFFGLFCVGNPHLSLMVIFVCFSYFFLTFFRLMQTNLSLLNMITLTSVTSFIYYISGTFIVFLLLALKVIIFLLILSFVLSYFYPKMVRFTEISFMALLLNIFSLGLFLGLVKLYFFNAAIFFTANNTPDIPSNVYLLLNGHDFLNIQSTALGILDFSSNTKPNGLVVQLCRFKQSEKLFHYLLQLLCLDSSWLRLHVTLVFT